MSHHERHEEQNGKRELPGIGSQGSRRYVGAVLVIILVLILVILVRLGTMYFRGPRPHPRAHNADMVCLGRALCLR
jgi:hypothetical protein